MILLGATVPFFRGGLGNREAFGQLPAEMVTLQAQGNLPGKRELTQALHRKCLEAGNQLQNDVAAMIPGRTWTWELDSEKSRSQLAALRRDLKAFEEAELAFEGSLPPEQRSKFEPRFSSSHALFEHLQGDAESLDTELRKGYPTRWHVTNDVLDIQKEINRWGKMHQRIADELHLDT